MAKKKTKSSFVGRLSKAHVEHRDDETRVSGGGDLPAGIDNGIAKLVDIRIGAFAKGNNEGEPFLMMAGTVVEPENVAVTDPKTKKVRYVPVQGLRTQFGPEPLCDTVAQNGNQTSLAEHWDRCLNNIRLLGVETKGTDPELFITEDDEGNPILGPGLEALLEAAPYFRFRTWSSKPTAQYPDPRVNHTWQGVVPNYEEGVSEEVEDGTGGEDEEWESEAEGPAVEEPVKEEEITEAPAEDWMELAAVADKGKPQKAATAAAERLGEKAEELGIEGYEEMESWSLVAEAIIATDGDSSADEETEEEDYEEEEYSEEPEEWVPAEGELGKFTPPKAKTPVAVQFVKVYTKTKKVDLKRLDTKKLVKGVPFDKLSAD